jgi:hypothetical protein
MLAAVLFVCNIAPTLEHKPTAALGDTAGRVRIDLSKFLLAYQGLTCSDAAAKYSSISPDVNIANVLR